MPRRLVPAALAVAFLVVADPAQAANLSLADGMLSYVAGAGKTSALTVAQTASQVVLTRLPADDDIVGSPPLGCSGGPQVFTCSGVNSVSVDAGDGNDAIDASGLTTVPVTMTGRNGSDTLVGGAQRDSLSGGDDNDTLAGGDGDDTLDGGAGADVIGGGDGIDTAEFGAPATASYSLDGAANDGAPGEGDNVEPDVENLAAGATGAVSITGSGVANWLVATSGKATIVGGGGSDILEGGPQDDTIDSRDGSQDTVLCGAGTDTVQADTLDIVSGSCENVTRSAVPGGSDDDRPPTILWSAPRVHARVTNSTTLAATASDDRGVTQVQFFDDDRLVCADSTAPYACTYRPRGSDVGRNTLIAMAIDGAGQTTAIVRTVTVTRFRPSSVSLSAKPGRDRTAPFRFNASGDVNLPRTVSAGQGCRGTVTVTAKAGRRTVSRRKVTLKGKCMYHVRLAYARSPGRTLKLVARFGGNSVMLARSSRSRTVRTA